MPMIRSEKADEVLADARRRLEELQEVHDKKLAEYNAAIVSSTEWYYDLHDDLTKAELLAMAEPLFEAKASQKKAEILRDVAHFLAVELHEPIHREVIESRPPLADMTIRDVERGRNAKRELIEYLQKTEHVIDGWDVGAMEAAIKAETLADIQLNVLTLWTHTSEDGSWKRTYDDAVAYVVWYHTNEIHNGSSSSGHRMVATAVAEAQSRWLRDNRGPDPLRHERR